LTLYAEAPLSFTDEQGRVMQMVGPHLALLARRMAAPVPDASPGQEPRPAADAGRLRMVVNR
jgi:hypothetical protein